MKSRFFLIFCAIGLVPIALGYGAKPSVSLDVLFGITVNTTNLTHIMRAVMGLYLGMVVFWLWGAFTTSMERPALVACAVFMFGLAAGRILSFVMDGLPHWLLIVYAVLEIVLGLVAVILYGEFIRRDPGIPKISRFAVCGTSKARARSTSFALP